MSHFYYVFGYNQLMSLGDPILYLQRRQTVQNEVEVGFV